MRRQPSEDSATGPPPTPGCWHLRALALFLLTHLVISEAGGSDFAPRSGCRLEECQRLHGGFTALVDEEWHFCRTVDEYLSCLEHARRGCKGNINFHVIHKGLGTLFSKRGCAEVLQAPPPAPAPRPPPTSPRPEEAEDEHEPEAPLDCEFRGVKEMRHCGLFGDPHLKTFEGHFQTCRVQGAWPLIDTPHLAVQVTNEPVRPGSYATVTTKITVIVKGGVSACTREKVYEAQAEFLPETFVDGSTSSGPVGEHSVALLAVRPNEQVEISLRHVAGRVVIHRRAGALAFSAQLPAVVALPEATNSAAQGSTQLCATGCPMREQLRSGDAAAQPAALGRAAALRHCAGRNLSATYLEWCVFDVVTTGDRAFVDAAVAAQRDLQLLDPAADAVLAQSARWTYSAAPRPCYAPLAPLIALCALLAR